MFVKYEKMQGWSYDLKFMAILTWCIKGISMLRFPSERLGEGCYCPAMLEFSDFISKQELMDIPLVGGSFTWSSNQGLPSWSWIDIFLVSQDWEA